ncbi:MAG TPA: hypothetical protein DIT48_12560 [Actinobacteria bacterium]|nr:hypothetical protein [Actinomycetota bacterium]HCP62691.1 hypothetical protein [Actinomycetota bacterium]
MTWDCADALALARFWAAVFGTDVDRGYASGGMNLAARRSRLASGRANLYFMSAKVKHRRRGLTRLSSKNQLTVPVDALAAAGLKPGDLLRVRAAEPGRIVFERDRDPFVVFAGALDGVYGPGYLQELRDEWDSRSSTPAS